MTSDRSEDVATALRSLYVRMWSLCAGWNRVPFLEKQLRFMLNEHNIHVRLAALGSIDAVTMSIDQHSFISLNRRLFPYPVSRTVDNDLLGWISRPAGHHARFVFLHEVGHLCLHKDVTAGLMAMPLESYSSNKVAMARACFVNPSDPVETRAARAIREIEADFYALVAMIPDQQLRRIARPSLQDVLSLLCAGDIHGMSPELFHRLTELARYRIEMFDEFSAMFESVSYESFSRETRKPFRNVRTNDATSSSSAANRPLKRVKLRKIIERHPIVMADPEILEVVRDEGYVVFNMNAEDLPYGY